MRETGVCILCGHLYDGVPDDKAEAEHLASAHDLARNEEGWLYPLPPPGSGAPDGI